MERDVLKLFLRAGPTRRFDVSYFTRRLLRAGQTDQLLFSQMFLNKAVLFKCVDLSGDKFRDAAHTVGTLVYMPYDEQRPSEGGEAFFFSDHRFRKYCEYKLQHRDFSTDAFEEDSRKLHVLDSIPTFSPFVIEQAFERSNTSIPEPYLQLTPEVRACVTSHLKGRLRPLIIAAYKCAKTNVEKAVEELTSKLFTLNDLRDIMPLVHALRLPPELAKEVLTSWLGIAYFEFEYSVLQPKLRDFATWIGKFSQPMEMLGQRDAEFLASQVTYIKQKIRSDWNDVVHISDDYRTSYDMMVFESKIDSFMKFLANAEGYYWRMGDVLGRLEQTIAVWKHFVRHDPDRRLSYAILSEMLDVLRCIHVSDPSRYFGNVAFAGTAK